MKPDDIVYFKEIHTALYGKEGGSYTYYFKPGDRYKIVSIQTVDGFFESKTGVIENLEDGTKHFGTSTIFSKLATVQEWRDLTINKLIES